jgi:hypothetical protein
MKEQKQRQWVLVKKFCELTGYSDRAVENKRHEGIWLEGLIWKKAPDGKINIDMLEYYKWVEGQRIHSSA